MLIREHNKLLDCIEKTIDAYGLDELIQIIAEVASAKADHMRDTWKDENLAREWDMQSANLINARLKSQEIYSGCERNKIEIKGA